MSGFAGRNAAIEYVEDLRAEQRHGTWLDPAGARMRLDDWVQRWTGTVDVETGATAVLGTDFHCPHIMVFTSFVTCSTPPRCRR